jgi:hypothetical protein
MSSYITIELDAFIRSLPEASDLSSSVAHIFGTQGDKTVTVRSDSLTSFNRYGHVHEVINASGAIELDLSLYDVFKLKLTGHVDLSVINIPPAPYQCVLYLQQDNVAPSMVTSWPVEIKHDEDRVPSLVSSLGGVDIFILGHYETGRIEMVRFAEFLA